MSVDDVACRNAQAKSKAYKLHDSNGLYLFITPAGNKLWRYNYAFFGKQRTFAIGSYPQTSLKDARQARDNAVEDLKSGIDPVMRRKEDKLLARFRNAQTVESVFREWHTQFEDTWTDKTAKTILRRLEIYIFPHLGNVPIDKVTPQMLLACLQRAEKKSRDVAERLLKYCYKAFLYAKNTGRKNDDPTQGLIYSLKRYKRGHYPAIDINELPILLEAMESEDRRIHRQTFLGLRLLMLTAVRTNELVKMRWSEIRLEDAQWIIPAERMKMKQDHIVPLSKQSIKIFEELKEMNGHREWVFPSVQHYKRHMSLSTFMRALERMGYKGKMTGHGFRSVFMGVCMEKLNYSHDIPDRQLAHAPKGKNGKAYDRASLLPQRTKLMQDYSDYIDSISKIHNKQRSNYERTTNYEINASFQTSWNYRTSQPPQQYQFVNFEKSNIGRGNPEAPQKWSLKCLDGRASSKMH
jgi:integrase